MSDFETCDCGRPTRSITGVCSYCRDKDAYTEPASVLRTAAPVGFAVCDNCGQAIDRPGFCGRCQRETDEWLDNLRSRL